MSLYNIPKDWILKKAPLEEGLEISAGCDKKTEWINEARRLTQEWGWTDMPGFEQYLEALFDTYFLEEGYMPLEAFEDEFSYA